MLHSNTLSNWLALGVTADRCVGPWCAVPRSPAVGPTSTRPTARLCAQLPGGHEISGLARRARLGPLPRTAGWAGLAGSTPAPAPFCGGVPGQAGRRETALRSVAHLSARTSSPGLGARLPPHPFGNGALGLRRGRLRPQPQASGPGPARTGQRCAPVSAHGQHPLPGRPLAARGSVRPGDLPGHQAHHRLGEGEQPQGLCAPPLRQDPATARRPRLQARLQARRKQRHPPAAAPPTGGRRRTPLAAATTRRRGPAASGLLQTDKGHYYWGYASGVVATKVPGWGEVVLPTDPDLQSRDASYFLPLWPAPKQSRLRPFGALDKAFDAHYVYDYFHQAGGFAAVPWADRADHRKTFSPDGLPLCAAGLPMPRTGTFWQKSNCLVPHEDARYGCPLADTQDAVCPVAHDNWAKGGCITTLPTSPGNRVRHELDRQSEAFKQRRRLCVRVPRLRQSAPSLPESAGGLCVCASALTLFSSQQPLRGLQAVGHADGQRILCPFELQREPPLIAGLAQNPDDRCQVYLTFPYDGAGEAGSVQAPVDMGGLLRARLAEVLEVHQGHQVGQARAQRRWGSG